MFFSFPAVLLLHVRRYAGHALNLTMFCCKEMHKALCFYDLHPGFFLRKKSSFFLSFFGKLDFGGPEFTRYFCRSSALPPNRVMRFLFNIQASTFSIFSAIYLSFVCIQCCQMEVCTGKHSQAGRGKRRTMHLLPEPWVSTLSAVADQVAGNLSALLNVLCFKMRWNRGLMALQD